MSLSGGMLGSSEYSLRASGLLLRAGVTIWARFCSAAAILRLLWMFQVMVGFLVDKEVMEATEVVVGASLIIPVSESVGAGSVEENIDGEQCEATAGLPFAARFLRFRSQLLNSC
ncbi:hypothetical protein FIBSPDRAFT_891908 [Athelia psychrophila]|uniref:Uncharacterized protein n=1 Tax=Athelia psychrophila TaxID=1759441 RepID=A0A166J142_9AGAM|nr:hypothetical protein FIBSPDRAFT_891908 [Fibularhizoctonia sp. CBS 109695]